MGIDALLNLSAFQIIEPWGTDRKLALTYPRGYKTARPALEPSLPNPRLKCTAGETMLETRQSAEARIAIIRAFSNVLYREEPRYADISKALAIAGVSTSVFYEQFKSEEDFVSAFLTDRHAMWMRWFEKEIEARFEATGGGLEIIADVLQEGFEDPKCFGVAFIHVVTETRDVAHEPCAIAKDQKEHLKRLIERLAVRMGLQHPDMAASAAVLVIERTIVRTLMTGSVKEAQTARLLFQCLQHA